MKNLITYLKTLWSWVADSQSTDVSLDCRLTVGSPSGLDAKWKQNPFMRFAVVLTLIFTIGSGNAWGAEEQINANSGVYSGSGNSGIHTWTMTSCTVVQAKGTGTAVNSSYPNRWYQNNLITFTPKSGYTISKIELTGSSGSYNGQTMTVTSGGGSLAVSSNKTTWTGTATSAVTIRLGTQFRFGTVKITYSAGASKTLSSIAITTAPTTTKYLDGETFSKSGAVVTATYSDASTANVSASATWNKTTLSTSDTQVQASYTEGGVTRTANQSINVYSVTVQVKDEDGNTLSGAGMPTASASGRTLTASASGNNYVFKRWVAVTAAGTSIASTSSASTSLTGTPTGAVTVKAEYYKPITITYKANGTNFTTQTYGYGGTLAFPSPGPSGASYSCTGKTFVGWVGEANKDYSHASTPPTYATAGGSITAAATYYAVFATATPGDDEEVAYSFLTADDAAESVTAGWGVTNGANNGYAATYGATWLRNNNAALPIFSFSPSVDVSKIVIKVRQSNTTGSNTVACSVGGNTIATNSMPSNSSQFDMTFEPASASSGQIIITCTNTSGSGTGKGSFYVASITLTQAGTTYSNYETNCCTPLGTINGSISANNPTSVTLTWDAVTGAEKYQVKVPGSSSHDSWTDVNTTSVTVTKSCGTAYTAYFRAIDTNGSHCSTGPESTLAIPAVSYTVTSTGVTNVTPATAFPSTTCTGFSIASMTPADGYTLPSTITVVNADHNWNSSTGALTISNVTGNVTITITGQVAANFTNGETVFIQADSKDYSAWKDDACVKAYFNTSGSGGSAVTTYWLFDATDTDAGKKLFAAVVPSSGLNQVQLQRFASNCSDWWNANGTVTKASSSGVNTFRSYGSADNNVAWNGSSTTLYLYGSQNSWGSSLGTFADQGSGVWTATISNYTPDATSKDYKIKTSYNNGWIGNTGSNNNATLSDMKVGSTYNVTATLNVTTHALTMSKTFVKGTVHFDMQGHGSAISDLTNVTAGSKISAPSTPSATGYDFGGWYKEPACTNQWNFGSDVVNETMTLYAKWTKHSYTISSTLNHCSSSPSIPSSYEYTGSAAGLTYTISADAGYRLPTSITVSGTTYTWNSATGALTLTGTITSNVSITITAVQTHTVDWYVGGSAPANKIGDDGQTTVVDHGGKISDFPATTPDGSACDKVFVGWTNTSSYEHGTSPLFNDVAGSPTINADASFYAVFATESSGGDPYYQKVTSTGDISNDGRYLIVYETDGVVFNGGLGTIDAGNNVISATFSEGAIEITDGNRSDLANAEFSIDMTNLYIKNKDNKYIYQDSYGNGLPNTTDPHDLHSISIDGNGDFIVEGKGQNSNSPFDYAVLRFNSATGAGNYRFRFYKNSQQKIQLYKYIGGTTYTGHTINCADCGTSVTPTYTASPTGGTVSVTKSASPVTSGSTVKTCTAVDLTVTITPATHYDLTGFTATGLTTGTATITPAVGSTLPVSVAQTFTVTVSAGATGTLTLAPTFTAQTPLSITLETHSKGTFTPIGDIYSGESFTFPTVTPSDAECSSFLGWIEGTTWSGDGTETDPTAITGLANYHAAGSSSGTLTTTKTYTAVFGEKDTQVIPAYQKVTSAPSNWSGDYLIVRDANSRAFDGSLSTLDAADNYIGVTISEGSITANSTINASKWTIAKVGATSNYTIKSASGYYIGRTASSNGLNSSTSEAYTNTLSYSDDHVVITSSGGPTLQMNSGTRFRYYTTSQQALQLYKYNPDAEVVSYTYTTNPACTPRYRVTISSATGGSPEADKTYEHSDETITITANPAAGYSFTSWTITKTTGGDNVTSTLLTGDKPTTANTTFTMPAYDITIAATYTKKMVSTLEVKDGATVVSTTTGPVSGTVNISTGANKTLDVVITPSDAYDHSWTATVSAGSTYASITNVTDDGFRVNGLAQGDATITVNAPNDGSAKSVTLTVQVRDIMPEEIILKRDGSNTPIETLIMYYDETNSKGQYVKVNVGYSPANPTNKAFTFSSALTGKVGSHSHAPASGYEVLVANGVTSDAVNCTFTSSADGSVTKVLAVTVLPILSDRFVDYVHGNATQTVSARLSDDRYSIIPDINTPSLSDASDANPTSEDCETSHYHLVGWLPQTTAEALWAAGTPITDATEGLVRAGESVEATGQTWCAIWAEEQ